MALLPNNPIYAPFIPFLSGFGMSYTSTTSITVVAGQCSDSTNINVISFTASQVLLANINGLNGLDTGSLANNTLYAVFAIGDSTENNPNGVLMSTSATAPYLPAGYDMKRRIGYVLTDGSAHILPFDQAIAANSSARTMWYDASISVLSGGTSATFAAQSLAACVPAQATNVIFQASVTPTAPADSVALRPTGSSSSAGYVVLSGAVAAVAQKAQIMCPCSAAASIDYKVTGAATLLVAAYVDQL